MAIIAIHLLSLAKIMAAKSMFVATITSSVDNNFRDYNYTSL